LDWFLGGGAGVFLEGGGGGGGGFFVKGGGGAENLKYKFCFAPKFAKYVHQPVISMGEGPCTLSHSYLTRTGSGSEAPSCRRQGGRGGRKGGAAAFLPPYFPRL